MAIISKFKKTGKAKKNMIFAGIGLALMIVAAAVSPAPDKGTLASSQTSLKVTVNATATPKPTQDPVVIKAAEDKATSDAAAKLQADKDAKVKADIDAKAQKAAEDKQKADAAVKIKAPAASLPSDQSINFGAAGLGDSVNLINKLFGEPTRINQKIDKDGYGFLVYKSDLFLVVFEKNIASNITIQYEALISDYHVKREIAEQNAKLLIPKDAVKVREYKKDADLDVVVYNSKLLTAKFSDGDFQNADGKVESGNFDVMYGLDENELVFSVVVAPRDNP